MDIHLSYTGNCSSIFQLKVPTSNNPNEFVMFRKLLLNRCQKEFDKTDLINLKDMQKAIDEAPASVRFSYIYIYLFIYIYIYPCFIISPNEVLLWFSIAASTRRPRRREHSKNSQPISFKLYMLDTPPPPRGTFLLKCILSEH